jgi:hypothetical protein
MDLTRNVATCTKLSRNYKRRAWVIVARSTVQRAYFEKCSRERRHIISWYGNCCEQITLTTGEARESVGKAVVAVGRLLRRYATRKVA